MAAQQIQVKLFTYSVVERKDEIEEVSTAASAAAAAATTADGRRRHSLSRRTRAHYRTYNAVPCVCRPARRRRIIRRVRETCTSTVVVIVAVVAVVVVHAGCLFYFLP